MSPRHLACVAAMTTGLLGCGGGGAPAVELTIDGAPGLVTSHSTLVLVGNTFIPADSTCPPSNEFIIIGSFGPATITTLNAATGAQGSGFLQTPWVCNSGADEVSWASNPISLAVGANAITVTMRDNRRSSTATITVTRSGG